jgi:hypothetical protein
MYSIAARRKNLIAYYAVFPSFPAARQSLLTTRRPPMHFKSLLHVRDHAKVRGRAHHLLSYIAQHVNMHTGEAFDLSVERLADRLDVTPQWVRQLRTRLVEAGELIVKQSRGRHPNVYIIPYERCQACQGRNPQVELPVDPIPDHPNPKVPAPQPETSPETLTASARNGDRPNPNVAVAQPATQPESLEAPTRNSDPTNPKLGEPFAAVLARIELQKEFYKEEKEKKDGATRNSPDTPPEKPEHQSPFWCEAHGFCHSEILPDQVTACWLRR